MVTANSWGRLPGAHDLSWSTALVDIRELGASNALLMLPFLDIPVMAVMAR